MANKLRASGQIQDKDRYITISEAKEQMVAMLEEIKDSIYAERWDLDRELDIQLSEEVVDLKVIEKIIQQKINALKGENNGNR